MDDTTAEPTQVPVLPAGAREWSSGTGLAILGGALALGILGDVLLRATPWGLNLFVWVLALVLTVLLVLRARNERLSGSHLALLGTVLVCAGAAAWRDAPALKALDTFIVCVALAALSDRAWGTLKAASRTALADCLAAGVQFCHFLFCGALRVAARDGGWRLSLRDHWLRRACSVLCGILIAVPLLLFFGWLLMSADAVFDVKVRQVLDVDVRKLVSHTTLIAVITWAAAGYLRGAAGSEPNRIRAGLGNLFQAKPGLFLEIVIPLAALNLLFLSFVAVQTRYLFGGHELVQATAGLSYAEYARRGFFELVTVLALCLPLLLLADWLVEARPRRLCTVFRALAWTMIVLLVIIAASALKRMGLYRDAYGLTRLRFYTTAFVLWMIVITAWFGGTVLRGKRQFFAVGVQVTGLLATLFLHLLNPEALIVRTNVTRAVAGTGLDVGYLTALSSDAVPELVKAVPALSPGQAEALSRHLEARATALRTGDWRAWSHARARARRSLQGGTTLVRGAAGPVLTE